MIKQYWPILNKIKNKIKLKLNKSFNQSIFNRATSEKFLPYTKSAQSQFYYPNIQLMIWGCHDFSAYLFNLLEGSNIQIIAFVNQTATSTATFCHRPVYDIKIICEDVDLQRIPILVVAPHLVDENGPCVNFESIRQFKMLMQEIKKVHNVNNDLLHPAALVDLLPIEYANKIISFGPPGSGNTLFNHIVAKIIQNHKKHFQAKHALRLLLEKMSQEYTQCMHQVLIDMTHMNDGYQFHMASWKIGHTYAIFSHQHQQAELYSFATRDHIIGSVFGYHQIPSLAYLEKLKLLKFKLYFIKRNPLDIILSCLNKASGIDKKTKQINMELFCLISKWTISQCQTAYPLLSHFHILCYEKLLSQPIAEIMHLMKKIGISSTKKVASTIWQQVSFKQLSNAPKDHFWSGGSGKWIDYFQKEHLSFLKDHGIESILEQFQYLDVLTQFKQLTASLPKHLWQAYCSATFMQELNNPIHHLHRDENANTLQFLQQYHGADACTSGNHVCMVGHANLSEKMKTMIQSQYLDQLLMAGAHREHRLV